MHRRQFLARTTASATSALLAACDSAPPALSGGFAGVDMARGHALRDLLASGRLPEPARIHRTQVVIAGGGVA
ncbi:MAG: hypothetical protein KAX68_06325, partial [Giesbergeria sp.]|nr:hypothetical protein [Giesbergeria sp.]